MLILSGDIGGTNSRLAVIKFSSSNKATIVTVSRYLNRDYKNFNDILEVFLKEQKVDKNKLQAAAFAVAGPILNKTVQLTNLSWIVTVSDLKNKLQLSQVFLLNDFFAIGYGLEMLTSCDLSILQKGIPKLRDVKAFIGAGTGLGVGFMVCHRDRYVVRATEGGHIDFAPANDLQVALWRYLKKKYQHVSYERILSGPGLVEIYNFISYTERLGLEKKILDRSTINQAVENERVALICRYAIDKKDPLAKKALEIFLCVYGAFAGNLALTTLPFSGLYIAGGIAPKLLSEIKSSLFINSFSDKGRFSHLLKKIPLFIVLDTDVGLKGAAVYCRSKLLDEN